MPSTVLAAACHCMHAATYLRNRFWHINCKCIHKRHVRSLKALSCRCMGPSQQKSVRHLCKRKSSHHRCHLISNLLHPRFRCTTIHLHTELSTARACMMTARRMCVKQPVTAGRFSCLSCCIVYMQILLPAGSATAMPSSIVQLGTPVLVRPRTHG